MINEDLVAEAREKYQPLGDVVIVSPRLLSRLADALENASATLEYDALYIAELEAQLADPKMRLARATTGSAS